MKDELETAKELAIEAGAILLKYFSDKISVRWKGEGNPVTDADQQASRFIVEAIHRRFPSDGILSEEELDDAVRLRKSRVWIVDPMDGTSEFVAGRTEFAVMIGLAVDGQPVMGVVYLPVERKLYCARLGCGAFAQMGTSNEQLRVSPESSPGQATIAVSRSHDSAISRRIRDALGIRSVVYAGGVGLKVAMICERRADLYLHVGSGTNEWDTCAPSIILHEAHGRMTDDFGKALQYNTATPQNLNGILATNGVLHDFAVRTVKRIIAPSEQMS